MPSNSDCVSPGDIFMLSPRAIIKAACPYADGICPNYDSWPSLESNTSTQIVAGPSNPIIPSVIVSVPPQVGECASVSIDLSGSSGHGGRPWKTASISIKGRGDIDQLQEFLRRSKILFDRPFLIPPEYIQAGSTYTFTCTLCNYLDSCATDVAVTNVVSTIVPVVVIEGPRMRTLKRSQRILTSRNVRV